MGNDRLMTQLKETGMIYLPPLLGITLVELRRALEALGLDERLVWICGGIVVHTNEGRG